MRTAMILKQVTQIGSNVRAFKAVAVGLLLQLDMAHGPCKINFEIDKIAQ